MRRVTAFEWDALRPGQSNDEPVNLVLHVGPVDGPGAELFYVELCTPIALAKVLERDRAVVGRHFPFVDRYNTEVIEAFINGRLRRLDGETWPQLAAKVGRIDLWEFEDYTEYREQ